MRPASLQGSRILSLFLCGTSLSVLGGCLTIVTPVPTSQLTSPLASAPACALNFGSASLQTSFSLGNAFNSYTQVGGAVLYGDSVILGTNQDVSGNYPWSVTLFETVTGALNIIDSGYLMNASTWGTWLEGMGLDMHGNIAVAGYAYDGSNGNVDHAIVRVYSGSSWQTIDLASGGAGDAQAGAVATNASTGTTFVGGMSPSGNSILWSSTDGVTYSAVASAPSPGLGFYSGLGIDDHGHIYAAVSHYLSGWSDATMLIVTSGDNGATWSTIDSGLQTYPNSTGNGYSPGVLISKAGSVIALETAGRDLSGNITDTIVRRSPTGAAGSFQSVADLGDGSAYYFPGGLVQDRAGSIYLSLGICPSFGTQVYAQCESAIYRSLDDGQTWAQIYSYAQPMVPAQPLLDSRGNLYIPGTLTGGAVNQGAVIAVPCI